MTRSSDPKSPSLDQGLQNHIGRQLRRFYDDIASEPVPDKFLALLDQLDNATPAAEAAADKTNSKTRGGAAESGR